MKRKVCIYCDTWESGGIESFLHNVLTHMELSCMEIDLVTARQKPSVFTAPLEKCGVRFIELSGSPRAVIRNLRGFSALLHARQYDVVHLNLFHGLALWYLRAAKRSGVPTRIAHSHNTALRSSLTRPLKLMIHYACRAVFSKDATALWACSEAAAEFLFSPKARAGKGWSFIPNGIDLRRFRFDEQMRGKVRGELCVSSDFVIGNVGRLCCQKNQVFLLEVLAEVCRKKPDSRLLLVGEGEDRESLVRRADELGLSEHVLFCGVSDHVEQLLCAMDVFAFPSRFEGLGIAVVEAQAAGLPVVCSEQIPGEAILSGRVSRVSIEDAGAWAEALLSCANGGCMGRDRGVDICRRFDIEAVTEKITRAFSNRGEFV